MLPKKEAERALEMIEEYRRTGTVPSGISYNMKMIFLLVKSTLDRRRRASESARRRREERRGQPRPEPQKPAQQQECVAQDSVGQNYVEQGYVEQPYGAAPKMCPTGLPPEKDAVL